MEPAPDVDEEYRKIMTATIYLKCNPATCDGKRNNEPDKITPYLGLKSDSSAENSLAPISQSCLAENTA